ncbi:BPSS1780 family membrane protein [Pseudoalteromonas denitrificans]|uniref:Uncharacterized membrane protein n=1 Tax=Pseudoalteromonas denitrificans DSM 6059 TaxID=1123010 RepID=A0A1I1EFI1_9GAMM|nr:BPSS1780 family membrane protein [Pseudoalteromonas denitrificans]SFB83750.1 Uncharacterized membrane protein [Pseudoalteromonas denitrificans DSM 6059]
MATELRVFKAKSGLDWFKAGWKIFKTQPSTFIFMQIFIILVGLIPLVMPLLQIPAALAAPFLIAGFYRAVLVKLQGQKIMLADILKPFSEKGARLGLFRLGLYQMAMGILLAIASSALFEDALLILQQNSENPEQVIEQFIAAIEPVSVLIFISLISVYMMAFAFAVPLVYFKKKQAIFEVIKVSLLAFWHNFAALGVFGGIISGLILISSLLSLLPLLVVMPISYIAFFVAYQAIFQIEIAEKSTDKHDEPPSSHGQFNA